MNNPLTSGKDRKLMKTAEDIFREVYHLLYINGMRSLCDALKSLEESGVKI